MSLPIAGKGDHADSFEQSGQFLEFPQNGGAAFRHVFSTAGSQPKVVCQFKPVLEKNLADRGLAGDPPLQVRLLAHLEGLGSLDGVMREKGQLIEHLKAEGKAVLNADDRRVSKIAAQTKKDVHFFGFSEKAAIRATTVNEKASGISFRLDLPQESITVDLKVAGQFMVINALAAAAVGQLLELPAAEIKAGLETFEPAWGRMNIVQTASGIHVIDDTYNANPDSMKAAITTLTSLRANNRSVFVAGDMLELGAQTESLHRQVGVWAATAKISKLLVTGEYAHAVAGGAKEAGMQSENIFTGSQEEILDTLKDALKPGDWVLVKGSRGAHMDTIVEGLKRWAGVKPEA